jgi:hypothetical protein
MLVAGAALSQRRHVKLGLTKSHGGPAVHADNCGVVV